MFNINLTPVDFQDDSKNQLEAKPHFLQTKFWANFKSLHGWKNLYFKGTSYLGDFYVSVLLRNFAKKYRKYVKIIAFFCLSWYNGGVGKILREGERKQ